MIAITFTNKAARELRERLELALGDEEAASAVWAYTFHTACLRILRRHVDLLGFESAFTIYDEDDKKRVITNVMKKLNLDPKTFDPRTVMGMISRAKDKLDDAEAVRCRCGRRLFPRKGLGYLPASTKRK